jgi:GTP-binding protein SAR1
MGGHEAVRDMWEEYYVSADGIIFMIDSADHTRFGEAKKVLSGIFSTTKISLRLYFRRSLKKS